MKGFEIKMIHKTKNDSVIISWNYEKDGDDLKGIVLIGEKDPLGIEQRIKIIEAYKDSDGVEFLNKLGIDISI